MKNTPIIISAPGKIHLLGEHAAVYGKPALLAAIDLRATVALIPASLKTKDATIVASFVQEKMKKIIEPIVKKELGIKQIPPYRLEISSQIPIGAGLGSSAAVSAAYIAALLVFLKVKWDLNLINNLAYEAEKVFHGNPSGGDNSTVVYGGLIWFRKENPDLKIIQPLRFTIPSKIADNFVLINTGTPKESTKEMVELVKAKGKRQKAKFRKIFDHQEQLVKKMLVVIQSGNENQLVQITRAGEKNLESMGVVSDDVVSIIRIIESYGGAAKVCGAGGKSGPAGILLCYHPSTSKITQIAKARNLPYFSTKLGVEGIRIEPKNIQSYNDR